MPAPKGSRRGNQVAAPQTADSPCIRKKFPVGPICCPTDAVNGLFALTPTLWLVPTNSLTYATDASFPKAASGCGALSGLVRLRHRSRAHRLWEDEWKSKGRKQLRPDRWAEHGQRGNRVIRER